MHVVYITSLKTFVNIIKKYFQPTILIKAFKSIKLTASRYHDRNEPAQQYHKKFSSAKLYQNHLC